MEGPIARFLAEDHQRLDALLDAATAAPDRVDLGPFAAFRAGLLRHIAIEEKLIFPALRHALPDTDAITAKLRVDHGALTALLVPTPTPDIVAKIRTLLRPHNVREEGPQGVYTRCDRALGSTAAERLAEEARAMPEIPLVPHNDGPIVERHAASAFDTAHGQWDEDKSDSHAS